MISKETDLPVDGRHTSYGSDASGLICGYVFSPKHKAQAVDSASALEWAVKAGDDFSSPVSLLVHLLRDQADVLQKIERNAASKVDDIEDKLLPGRLKTLRGNFGKLRRSRLLS